jgi:hypothetical protein
MSIVSWSQAERPNVDSVLEPGRYRHFKGGEYEVVFVGRHTETDEEVVVYFSADEPDEVWVRPVDMFLEPVKRPEGWLPRFERRPQVSTWDLFPTSLSDALQAVKIPLFIGHFFGRGRLHHKRRVKSRSSPSSSTPPARPGREPNGTRHQVLSGP